MSDIAIKICDLDVKKLNEELNEALAEEWLAYYQYWVGAQVAQGVQDALVRDEFMEHAKEELEHAEKIAKRLAELGGIPLTHPNQWEKKAKCKYEEPKDFSSLKLLEQNLEHDLNFAICKRIALRARAGLLEDNTCGATHYHTKQLCPAWSIGKIPCAELGSHVFYNDIEK